MTESRMLWVAIVAWRDHNKENFALYTCMITILAHVTCNKAANNIKKITINFVEEKFNPFRQRAKYHFTDPN